MRGGRRCLKTPWPRRRSLDFWRAESLSAPARHCPLGSPLALQGFMENESFVHPNVPTPPVFALRSPSVFVFKNRDYPKETQNRNQATQVSQQQKKINKAIQSTNKHL